MIKYLRHYNVKKDNPEEMESIQPDRLNTAKFHLKYLKAMLAERNQKYDKNKTDVLISSPKSESSIREIPVPQFIIDLIIKNDLYRRDAYLLTGEVSRFIEPRTLENKFNKTKFDGDFKKIIKK